jgi:hypothetical protein
MFILRMNGAAFDYKSLTRLAVAKTVSVRLQAQAPELSTHRTSSRLQLSVAQVPESKAQYRLKLDQRRFAGWMWNLERDSVARRRLADRQRDGQQNEKDDHPIYPIRREKA